MSQLNPIHKPTFHFLKYYHSTSSHLCLGLPSNIFLADLPSGIFSLCLPNKTMYTPFPSNIRATCFAHLILLEFITRKILGAVYNSWRSTLYNFPHSPVTSSLLGTNILVHNLLSNTLRLRPSLNVRQPIRLGY
jgi:hypothetical protein